MCAYKTTTTKLPLQKRKKARSSRVQIESFFYHMCRDLGRLCSAAEHTAPHSNAAPQRAKSISAMYSPGRCTPPVTRQAGDPLFFFSKFSSRHKWFNSFKCRTSIKDGSCVRNLPTFSAAHHNCHYLADASPGD